MFLQSRGLAPLPIKGVLQGFKRPPKISMYPSGAILHWDADLDPYAEQTGGPHTFNHAILSPQYQRNADGSYANVGAKPAVDVFDGERWVRSCGAVNNVLPSGSDDFTTWTATAMGVAAVSGGHSLIPTAANGTHEIYRSGVLTGVNFVSLDVKPSGYSRVQLFEAANTGATATFELTGDGSVIYEGSGAVGSIEKLADGYYRISYTYTNPGAYRTLLRVVAPAYTGTGVYGFLADGISGVIVRHPSIVFSTYPVPYTPPGTTMPASNATTTNGMWFSLPDGSPLWQALTGEPLTLATRVRMGVGSGDLPNGAIYQLLSANTAGDGVQGISKGGSGESRIVRSSDGISGIMIPDVPWSRNVIINRVTQVNTAGTQFRVGYMIDGTHTTIQWGSWVSFDGSFNPSTLYRLMLGYNNAYPMWFNKITAWKEQVSDARILEAMA